MSGSVVRRNGEQASCEPRRKGKIRCDHRRPICDRYRRRKMEPQCWYYPAPLSGSRIPFSESSLRNRETQPSCNTDNQACATSTDSQADNAGSPFEPTSYIAPGSNDTDVVEGRGPLTHNKNVAMVVNILSHLRRMVQLEELVERYYATSQTAIVHALVILPAVSNIKRHAQPVLDDTTNGNEMMIELARKVLNSTLTEVNVPFFGTSEDIRLETIGLFYALAARSYVHLFSFDVVYQRDNEFIDAMLKSGTECLHISRSVAPRIQDAIVWLAYENLLLTTYVHGDTSEYYHTSAVMNAQSMLTTILTGPHVFRGLGEVMTDVLASGTHRATPEKQTVSFDITECRRKTFATIHQVDKYIATLFDLPPRHSRHYSNVVLPLDLSYDELFVERIGSEEALRRVDANGWSKIGKHTNSTWVRLQYILARVREEIPEYQFHPLTTECKDGLK
jgi:hypothetical protein